MIVRLANSEDPDQTAGAVWSGSALFDQSFLVGNVFKILEHMPLKEYLLLLLFIVNMTLFCYILVFTNLFCYTFVWY